jgi:hypothetical protein
MALKGDPAAGAATCGRTTLGGGDHGESSYTRILRVASDHRRGCGRRATLRLVLADAQVNVLEYGRKKYELEEVFWVCEGDHGQ